MRFAIALVVLCACGRRNAHVPRGASEPAVRAGWLGCDGITSQTSSPRGDPGASSGRGGTACRRPLQPRNGSVESFFPKGCLSQKQWRPCEVSDGVPDARSEGPRDVDGQLIHITHAVTRLSAMRHGREICP